MFKMSKNYPFAKYLKWKLFLQTVKAPLTTLVKIKDNKWRKF